MSSEDPRERDDLCGRELISKEPSNPDLAEMYDPETWYEGKDGAHYCRREVWEDADTDRCIWHADISGKPADELAAAQSDGPARLDRAVLQGSDLSNDFSFSGYRLVHADLRNTDLRGANLSNAGLLGADLSNAVLLNTDLNGANLLEADLTGSQLMAADLRDSILARANLRDAQMNHADLRATKLIHANLRDANLAKADLREANLGDTDMRNAKFGNADLRGAELIEGRFSDSTFKEADMRGAILERADFSRANLFDVNLTGAQLYGMVLSNVQLNTETEFGSHYTGDGSEANPDKAAWTLRQLEQLFYDNALPEKAREAYLDRKDHRRKQYWQQSLVPDSIRRVVAGMKSGLRWVRQGTGTLAKTLVDGLTRFERLIATVRWARAALVGATTRYAASPWRVVGVSLAVVGLSTVAYKLFGSLVRPPRPNNAVMIGGDIVSGTPLILPPWLAEWLQSLYFSVVTFTTLGYGDLQPANGAAQTVATLESFAGAVLMALLVYVLGRRATR